MAYRPKPIKKGTYPKDMLNSYREKFPECDGHGAVFLRSAELVQVLAENAHLTANQAARLLATFLGLGTLHRMTVPGCTEAKTSSDPHSVVNGTPSNPIRNLQACFLYKTKKHGHSALSAPIPLRSLE